MSKWWMLARTVGKYAAVASAGAGAGAGFFDEWNRRNLDSRIELATRRVAADIRFPDFEDSVPAGYRGRVFQLRQDYPTARPSASVKPWDSIDPILNPHGYMMAIKEYVLEGNVSTDWRVERNSVRNWYHVPWLHPGAAGREFIHGMTRERTSRPGELGPGQTGFIQNWAIGFYNEEGGYTVGQVWNDSNDPDPTKAQFSNGTAVVKVLFTEADPTQVPELEGAFEWRANVHQNRPTSPKEIKTLRLLQVDVAVKEPRVAETTGWVFGTFIYDKDAPGSTPWDKLVPIGMMWGNDPGVTPSDVTSGRKTLKETYVNPAVPALGKRRLGWGGRLNGPVDNFISSCSSCHSTAQWPPRSSLVPPREATEEQRLRWFRNIKAHEPFDEGGIPLDYSLQLLFGIRNFRRIEEEARRIEEIDLDGGPAEENSGATAEMNILSRPLSR